VTRYLSQVLQNLQKVYQFTTSQQTAPEEIELGVPIQLVHDVSRDSKYGSGPGQNEGYWLMHAANTHVIVGTLTLLISPTGPTNRLNGFPAYDPDKFQLWVIRGWIDASDFLDFEEAGIFLIHSVTSIGPTGAAAAASANDAVMVVRGLAFNAIGGFPGRSNSNAPQSPQSNFDPIPLLQRNDGAGAVIGFTSTSDIGGTVAIDFNVLLWLGRRGATPPGMS